MAAALAEYVESLTLWQGRRAGETLELHPWQRRFLRGGFAQQADAALTLARGGGKTTLCAAIAAATVDVDGPLVQRGAECLLVASSFDQALIAFRHVQRFLGSTLDRYGVGVKGRYRVQDSANRASILDKQTGAMLTVLGSDPRRLHGHAPSLLIYDEVAQWPPGRAGPMLAALKTSRGKIEGSRALWLGTRPAAPDHPFERALQGHGTAYQQVHAAPADAPPFQRRMWLRSNPGLDHLPDLEAAIRAEVQDARRDPEALASFRALRLNQGVSDVTVSALVDAETWLRAEALPEPEVRSTDYVLGLDLGQSAAMSAAAAYFADGWLEAVACFPELPDLRDRGLADGVGDLYARMAERGELFQAGRRVSDIPALLAECLHRWGMPSAVVCDRWREAELRQHLEAAGFPRAALVVRGQGFQDGGADVREFRAAMLARRVRPPESLLLRAGMAEARVVGDPAGNWKLAKNAQGGRRAAARDDACAAACPAPRRSSRRDVEPTTRASMPVSTGSRGGCWSLAPATASGSRSGCRIARGTSLPTSRACGTARRWFRSTCG